MRVGWLGWPVGALGPQYQMVWSAHALGAWFEGMRAHHAGEGLKVAPRGGNILRPGLLYPNPDVAPRFRAPQSLKTPLKASSEASAVVHQPYVTGEYSARGTNVRACYSV